MEFQFIANLRNRAISGWNAFLYNKPEKYLYVVPLAPHVFLTSVTAIRPAIWTSTLTFDFKLPSEAALEAEIPSGNKSISNSNPEWLFRSGPEESPT
jgi:hypothetical protein